ncbi:MAG TPA: DUF2330 domain-containing protein [Verrucomicrobiae bacterium]|nr:DUF2330 domain-containing protein [Verrucomicrobiae bacterium]
MKSSSRVLLSLLIAVCLAPIAGWADGTFVAPKFVWDKHQDINEPTQKAIIVYDAGREDLILQVKYQGPLNQFGWLVPVPARPSVEAASMKCFYELSRFTQQQRLNQQWLRRRPTYGSLDTDDQSTRHPAPVKVIETKTVGAYDIAVLSTKESGALAKWLDDNHFYVPAEKSNILERYSQMNWYFVAVKINLGGWFFDSPSTSKKLAFGELNPLQISFASDRCVFPLKISSINGKPSEVQVYVLAQEPLLDQAMYMHDLSVIYSNDVARVERLKQHFEQMRKSHEGFRARRGLPPLPPLLDDDIWKSGFPVRALPDELTEFDRAAPGDLPYCARVIPRTLGRSWWIVKKTWSFDSDQMRDLDFGPALPVLAEMLGSEKYGYIAAQDISDLGTNAIPVLLAAVDGSGPIMRANAATVLENDSDLYSNAQVQAAAPALLKSPWPEARLAALDILTSGPNRNVIPIEEVLPLLKDSDAQVRDQAEYAVVRSADVQKFAPLFHTMLTDTNSAVQIAGLRVIQIKGLPVTHEELFPFFKIPDRRAVGMAIGYFRDSQGRYDLSNEQGIPLLHNTEPIARCIGLQILKQNAAADSIALASPLLDDPNPTVKFIAARDIRQLKEARLGER